MTGRRLGRPDSTFLWRWEELTRRRAHATAVALIAAAGLTLAPAANAAVVPNIFVRSCYFGCSPYVQSNGAYKAEYAELIHHQELGRHVVVPAPCRPPLLVASRRRRCSVV